MWWRSRRLGKLAEAWRREQHDRTSKADQDEALEGSSPERWDAQLAMVASWVSLLQTLH